MTERYTLTSRGISPRFGICDTEQREIIERFDDLNDASLRVMFLNGKSSRGPVVQEPEDSPMTREQIQSLSSRELRAIVHSTVSTGKFWLEYNYARDELARRATQCGCNHCVTTLREMAETPERNEPMTHNQFALGLKYYGEQRNQRNEP